MSNFVIRLLQMSAVGGVLILLVAGLRLLMKRAPKWAVVLLWAVVGVRLLCPVFIGSSLGLLPGPETRTAISTQAPADTAAPVETEKTAMTTEAPTQAATAAPTAKPSAEATAEPARTAASEMRTQAPVSPGVTGKTETPTKTAFPWTTAAFIVWLAGVGVFIGYVIYCWLRTRFGLATAVKHSEGVYESEFVTSPFLMGIINPRIFIPYGMNEESLGCVLAHERAHVKRGDHVWKLLGFAALVVHWFNPLCWLAYALFCADIEAACDEKVIAPLSDKERAGYSDALLSFAKGVNKLAVFPPSFAESSTASRIKRVLGYKKPAVWAAAVCVLLSMLLVGCSLLTSKSKKDSPSQGIVHTDTEKDDKSTKEPASGTALPTAEPAKSDLEFMGFRTVMTLPAEARVRDRLKQGVIGYIKDEAGNIGPADVTAISDEEFMILNSAYDEILIADPSGVKKIIPLSGFEEPTRAAYQKGTIAVLDAGQIVVMDDNGRVKLNVPVPVDDDGWNGGAAVFEFIGGRLYWQTVGEDGAAYVLTEDGLRETEPVQRVYVSTSHASVTRDGRVWTVPFGEPHYVNAVGTADERLLALTYAGGSGNLIVRAGVYIAGSDDYAAAEISLDGLACAPEPQCFCMSPSGRAYMLTCSWDSAEITELVFAGPNDTGEDVFTFADPAFEKSVVDRYGVLEPEQYAGIDYLYLNGVRELSDLAKFPAVTQIMISNSPDADLGGLALCTRLKNLFIYGSGVKDMSFVSALPGLESLLVEGEGDLDLSPLAEAKKLTTLRIFTDGAADVTPLAELKLTDLTLRINGGFEPEPLSEIKTLKDLHIFDSGLRDIGFVSELSDLNVLELGSNHIEDISPAAGLKKLEQFNAENNYIKDLSPLYGLAELVNIDVSWNPADGDDVEALKKALDKSELYVNAYPYDRDALACWALDLDGDGEDEYFYADLENIFMDFVSYAWLENKEHHRIGEVMYCGSGHVAYGSYAVVESPEYGTCIMKTAPEFYGQYYGYTLYKLVNGELKSVYSETFYNYDEEGDNSFDPDEAAAYEERVNALYASGRLLITTDRYGLMEQTFGAGDIFAAIDDGDVFAVICSYGSVGNGIGLAASGENGSGFKVFDKLVYSRVRVEPFIG